METERLMTQATFPVVPMSGIITWLLNAFVGARPSLVLPRIFSR